MIARRWHGRIRSDRSAAYAKLMREVAIPDYAGIEGNRGAWCLMRTEGEVTHVEMLTLWEDMAPIEAFAGRPSEAAKYYDFDGDFLLEKEPTVLHFEVCGST